MRVISWVVLMGMTPFLAGCGLVATVAVPAAVVEGVSLATTEKSASDHVISYLSGKDCSSPRKDRGETYCREDEPNPSPAAHCYRTLGEVTCYDRPDPFKDGAMPVGTPDRTARTP